MILDEKNEFCDSTSVAAAASTALLGDVIDLESIGLYQAGGADLWFIIQVDTEVITGGSAGTIQFILASDAQAAIATDGSATVHFDTGTLVTDDAAANDSRLNAGGVVCAVKLPAGSYERYLGVLCTIATTTVTAGAISAFLTRDYGRVKHYADGTN